VNRAVAEAWERGILTSATLMVNMPAFEDAVRVARAHPSLGVGVHLNLTSGTPVAAAGSVPALTGPEGRFSPLGTVLKRLSLAQLDLAQVEVELAAQIERALAAGIAVTHLDSHHHVHSHPALHGLVIGLARRYGIRAVRSTAELGVGGIARSAGMVLRGSRVGPVRPVGPVGRVGQGPAAGGSEGEAARVAGPSLEGRSTAPETPRARYLKTVALSLFGLLLRGRARRAGLAAPDHFRGLMLDTAFDTDKLLPVLEQLPSGATELMCHPGYVDEDLRRTTSYSAGRDSELAALLDPRARALLESRGIRLGSFAEI
jgi:predicted glycoside hydrolase/deacetylase ChbG (UPF0249 family)